MKNGTEHAYRETKLYRMCIVQLSASIIPLNKFCTKNLHFFLYMEKKVCRGIYSKNDVNLGIYDNQKKGSLSVIKEWVLK